MARHPVAVDSLAEPGALFRDAMSALASGVAVITARRADGRPAGLLATSIAAYSAAPASIRRLPSAVLQRPPASSTRTSSAA